MRLIFFVVFVFVLTGLSLVTIEHYLFPYLTTVKWFSQSKLFQRATQDVVVVNKTEQVTVSEDVSISRYSNKSAASVVEIISSVRDLKNKPGQPKSKVASGLVVTADGLILAYGDGIISENADYRIFTTEQNSYSARLIAVDSFSGLALLKIDNVSDLPTTSFIAPEDIQAGAKVVAMGRNGSNFQIVYKSGLISEFDPDFSLAGPVALSEKLQGVYFADFALTSQSDENMLGGTVADYNGNVVGLLGSTKGASGEQFFIIQVNYIKNLTDQYISSGDLKRGSMGIYYLNLTKETAYLNSSSVDHGAMVFSPSGQQGLAVISGSAADKAGIKIGDIIESVNSDEVGPSANLAQLVAKYKPGDKIDLKIMRSGQEMNVSVVLG